MTEEHFDNNFTPVKNEFPNRNGSYDDCMFETYGEELSFVQDQQKKDATKVWTILDSDDDKYIEVIAPGMHIVNRLGYLITEESWTDAEDEVCIEREF